MNEPYYASLALTSACAARHVGWEDPEHAALRYEAVKRHILPNESCLDLGAGLGAFGRHLAGHTPHYIPIEQDPTFLARGRHESPDFPWIAGDLYTHPLPSADTVVAIGTLVDGSSLRNDGVRLGRIRTLLERAQAHAHRLAILVLLDQDWLESHPTRHLEPALGGLRRAELPWLGADLRLEKPLETDFLLLAPGLKAAP